MLLHLCEEVLALPQAIMRITRRTSPKFCGCVFLYKSIDSSSLGCEQAVHGGAAGDPGHAEPEVVLWVSGAADAGHIQPLVPDVRHHGLRRLHPQGGWTFATVDLHALHFPRSHLRPWELVDGELPQLSGSIKASLTYLAICSTQNRNS